MAQVKKVTYLDPSVAGWIDKMAKAEHRTVSQFMAKVLGEAAGRNGVQPLTPPRVMGAIPPPKPVPFPWGTPVARAPAPQAKEPEWTVDWDKVRAGLPPEEDAAAEADGEGK